MAINLADNNPRIVYSVAQGVSQTVFAVPFEFFEDSDVNVYVDGVEKTEGTDYTLSGGSGSTGTLTFTSAVVGASGGSTVVLFRRIAIERTTDFQQGQDINRDALNEQLDTLTALVADMNDRWERSVRLDDSDAGEVSFVLPSSSERAGNYLSFNSEGEPIITSGTVLDWTERSVTNLSGASKVNFLGLPSSVYDIEIWLHRASADVGVVSLCQLSSGGFVTTGYQAQAQSGSTAYVNSSGFPFALSPSSTGLSGVIRLHRLSSNTWISEHNLGGTNDALSAASTSRGGGSVTLGGVLDGVRLDSLSLFDAGQVKIRYRS